MSATNAKAQAQAQATRPVVAITGLNGYIAIHVALKFLQEGYDVRGSVRSETSVERIKANPVWKEWIDQGRVEVVVVPDLEGDLTALLKGVEIVVHLAAPVDMSLTSWEAYKNPTTNGVLNVLTQATKFDTIKAISLMSSIAAAFNPVPNNQQLGKVYTEADWFPYDETFCETLDNSNPFASVLWYCAAKKYAEFAVEKWLKENEHDFSVATLCPPMTYGPMLHLSSPDQFNGLNSSQPGWISLIKGKDSPVPDPEATTYADPRDVAEAFYQAAAQGKNERYLIASDSYTYQMFVDEFRKQRPDLDAYFPLGNPGAPTPNEQGFWTIDTSKSVKQLGLKYHTLPESSKDTLEHYENIGVFKVAPGSWVKEN
ncbi:uncharacterized protein I303_104209 [Kwoniella dejecticola CBS 10117]|uniref:NAD-dependent epimerase/dehydratase domain-containing protein n=1 Tax=Kwoniella dejecticola CBS 10117 TaxID=1296121 RepID=A0A1A6A601_9TREE|nr:uncharacterized protein I303_04815 [Kwoniella dejecticola CBS 10117]OBR85479.1 hypothetical protein I303_04815 [Kwoniella dejecticola CBS 10117]